MKITKKLLESIFRTKKIKPIIEQLIFENGKHLDINLLSGDLDDEPDEDPEDVIEFMSKYREKNKHISYPWSSNIFNELPYILKNILSHTREEIEEILKHDIYKPLNKTDYVSKKIPRDLHNKIIGLKSYVYYLGFYAKEKYARPEYKLIVTTEVKDNDYDIIYKIYLKFFKCHKHGKDEQIANQSFEFPIFLSNKYLKSNNLKITTTKQLGEGLSSSYIKHSISKILKDFKIRFLDREINFEDVEEYEDKDIDDSLEEIINNNNKNNKDNKTKVKNYNYYYPEGDKLYDIVFTLFSIKNLLKDSDLKESKKVKNNLFSRIPDISAINFRKELEKHRKDVKNKKTKKHNISYVYYFDSKEKDITYKLVLNIIYTDKTIGLFCTIEKLQAYSRPVILKEYNQRPFVLFDETNNSNESETYAQKTRQMIEFLKNICN